MEKDQEVLEYIVKALVDHPEAVRISRIIDQNGVLLSVDVHLEDMGKVIGKKGVTAEAIRSIVRVVGAKNRARVSVRINEPEGSTRHVADTSTSASAEDMKNVVHEKPVQIMKSVDEAMEDLNLG